jgi:hypothetical protein
VSGSQEEELIAVTLPVPVALSLRKSVLYYETLLFPSSSVALVASTVASCACCRLQCSRQSHAGDEGADKAARPKIAACSRERQKLGKTQNLATLKEQALICRYIILTSVFVAQVRRPC